MKLTKRRILILVMAILAITSFATFFILQTNATPNVAIVYSAKINSEYVIGDEFTIPEGKITIEGQSVSGDPTIEYPNGTENAVTVGSKITLTQSGKYTLRYSAQVSGKIYTKETTFNVAGQIATPSSTNSSVEYRKVTELGANSNALVLSIYTGDSISFDHIFDMTKMSSAVTILEGFVLPETQGKADFSKMIFTFSDIEDPSVQIVIQGNFDNDSNAYGLTFFTAAGNGQTQCGLEYYGKLHVNDGLGCLVPHSFMAMDTGVYYGHQSPTPMNPDKRLFSITYDYERNQTWAGGKIISDLDDSYYYDTLWTGFPSGKAKLTISASGYSATTATICLTKVLGVDLSATSVEDTTAPVITVDTDYVEMPDARVGCNYPIPSATAFDDISGECKVRTTVCFNYGTDSESMVDVDNNLFKVSNVGRYAIVYEATDTSGNVARKVLWVTAKLSQYIPQLTIEISGEQTSCTLGELLTLPEATINGGSGDTTINVVISKGSKICPITNDQFRLEEEGEWTVTFTATDYIGDYTSTSYNIQATRTDTPIIKHEPNLPYGYISGSKYVLPELYAYDYSTGKAVEKLCNVKVSYNGAEKTYTSGATFTPVVENNQDKIKLEYFVDNYVVYTKELPVAIVWSEQEYEMILSIENYFVTTNATIQNQYKLNDEMTGILVNTTGSQSKLQFINAQSINNFSVKLATVPNQSKYSTIKLILRDSQDPSIVLTATLSKGDGVCELSVGGTVMEVAIDLDSTTSQDIIFGFSDNNFEMNGTKLSVVTDDNGNIFEGFTSGKMYYEIEVDNNEDSQLFIHKICDIYVTLKDDKAGPIISISGNYGGSVEKGGTYTITKASACDVFAPNTTLTVTVTDASGNVLTDINGTQLKDVDGTKEYKVVLSEFGVYTVKYTGKEANWETTKKSIKSYEVRVIDEINPTITFNGSFQTTAKVGDYIYIPDYVVADNYSTVENINVIKLITTANGIPVMLDSNKNAIKATSKGTYRIDILVIDEAGNTVQVVKFVTVS